MATAVPLSDTKRKLLDLFLRQKVTRAGQTSGISRCPAGAPKLLAPSQEQLLIREQTAGGVPLYNESITLKFNCAIDRTTLERSIAEILRRHEIWRTSYEALEGQLVQVVHPAQDRFPLPSVDLRSASEREREAQVLRLGLDQAGRPFDLRNGPLLRATLVSITDSEYWVVMTAHQSIVDGVSVYQILPTELSRVYEAFSAGRLSPLDEPDLQFSDFAFWQRQSLTSAEDARQIEYWRGKLGGEIPTLSWPGTARPIKRSHRGHIRSFTLPCRLADSAHALCRTHGVTMFAVLLAALYSLLRLYTGKSDLIVGTLSPAGRKRSEVGNLLGYFLNPVALRIDLSDDPTFFELLRRVQIITSEAISHDDVPFERVVEALKPVRDTSRNPYIDVAISLQPNMPDSGSLCSVTSMDAESGGSMFDLYIAFIDRRDGLHARVQYNPDIFGINQMQQMIEDLRSVLDLVTAQPQVRISTISIQE